MKWVIPASSLIIVLLIGFLFIYVPATTEYVRSFSPIERKVEILFGGDMMFDRTIRLAMLEHGDNHIFSCIQEILQNADLVVANLEGPITSHASKSVASKVGEPNNFTFTFPTSTATLLARHNISLVNLGNNHIMNFGREGLAQTKYWLDGARVTYFGDPDLPEEERVERFTRKGIKFSFVNWSDWTPVGKPSASNGAGELNPVVRQIALEKEAGRLVVVYTHWGDEYMPPPARVKQLARSFIDAGAEIVIGSHPHIVQEHEFYGSTTLTTGKDKHIYYSLGNFVFDQYWNEAVRRGLLLKVSFTPKDISSVEEIPIDSRRDRRTCPV